MQEINLTARTRPESGKERVKKLRTQGMVPAVIYGHGKSAIPLTLEAKDLVPVFKAGTSENIIITLKVDDDKTFKAIIRNVQTEPIKNKLLHLDFQEIHMAEKIKVRVPIETVGTPEGVKNQGGILEHILDMVEVSCLPADIPEKIVVDISGLKVGQSFHLGDISMDRVEIQADKAQVVVTVIAPIVEAEPTSEEAAAAPKEPEVITKGKKEEEGEVAES